MEITFLKNKINGEAKQVIHRREKNALKRAVFSAQMGCHYTVILVSEKRILNSYKSTLQIQ